MQILMQFHPDGPELRRHNFLDVKLACKLVAQHNEGHNFAHEDRPLAQ